jgi:hypothetical protein
VIAPRPALVEATAGGALPVSARTPQLVVPSLGIPGRRLLLMALGIVVGVAGMLAVLSAGISLVAGGSTQASAMSSEAYGPPVALREGSGLAGALEQGMVASQPGAYDMSLAAMVAADDYNKFGVLRAMADIEAKRIAEVEAARAAQASSARPAPGTATSLGRASGYAVGTVLNARLTIYGCTGPGGGFCGGMASGVKVFEGAAACSYDLPFGTRFRIHSDPTGRVYECLDRGHLASSWVDVFFYNTSEGIHWASLLSGTRVTIEIVN